MISSIHRALGLCLALMSLSVYAGGLPPGLKVVDTVVGAGTEAVQHATVKLHYSGYLADGTPFDSSHGRGEPFSFQLNTGTVIPGWDLGIEGMRVGGRRTLEIGPALAYGPRGAGKTIPPNATLKFDLELLEVVPPRYEHIDVETVRARLAKGVKLLDIRREDEWRHTGVIDGAVLLTAFDERGRLSPDFPKQLSQAVSPDEPVMLICRTGTRTAVLANTLVERAGYQHVASVRGGIVNWMTKGGAVKPAL